MASASPHTEVIILAAGKGVRMNSALPKVLHRVCGRSLVHRALIAALGVSPGRIVVVVGYGQERVRAELEALSVNGSFHGVPLETVIQDKQLGTGHAVQMAFPRLRAESKSVVVMPGDCPLISAEEMEKLAEGFASSGEKLRFLTANFANPTGFGRVVRGKREEVIGIVEEKDASAEQRAIKEINSSIYIFERTLLEKGLKQLKPANAQGEYYLTDLIDFSVKGGEKVTALRLNSPEAVLGANNRMELSELERKRRLQINERVMLSGVTLEDPSSTYIDEDVQIGADTFIGANTRLRGKTVIESNVTIEGNASISNSRIGKETRIKFNCVIDDSVLEQGCEIGPFAHLRPGSHLHNKVKIGNFVETKKTEMQEGAKANHLSYLGDATIGAHTNIGAGTITCNYDGQKKHQTEIGADTFIGSNSCLVAPVKIGQNAYVGAGSTITKDVPQGALGIARGRQNNIDGWMTKRKGSKKLD